MHEASAFWDREITAPTHRSWMEPLAVRLYINESIAPGNRAWPLDWLERIHPGEVGRGLSIGCGSGALERDLIRRRLVRNVDAMDASTASLSVARRLAKKERMAEHLHYFEADFNEFHPRKQAYDAVFFNQSLHHVSAIERLFRRLLTAMKRGAYLYIDEYVGPSRTDWNRELLRRQQSIFQKIPAEWRTVDRLPLPIQQDDPSEAVRSGEIIHLLSIGFDFIERRDYGGAILSVLYPYIDWSRASQNLLEELIVEDQRATDDGLSFHTVATLRAKDGVRLWIARLRYTVVPKLRRVRYLFVRYGLRRGDARW